MIDISKKPQEYSPLFFGDYGGISRLDIGGDPQFKRLAEVDEANAWSLNLVSCSQDRWYDLPPEGFSKFRKTLAYQTLMDSVVPNIFSVLSELATDPWLTYLYSRISTMEQVHAMTYSSGVSQATGAKAEEFLDIIYTDENLQQRVAPEIEVADRFIQASHNWSPTLDNKRLLIETLLRVLALEGVKFPFSFFTNWTINKAYGNLAQGFSQLLIKISVDEMQVHTTTGATVLKKLAKDKRFADVFEGEWFADTATRVFNDTALAEIQWAEYLLEDGEVPGFNIEICAHFIKYWTDKRLIEINQPPIFNVKKNDVESWFDDYRNPNAKHSALQEISSITYQRNTLVDDLFKFDIGVQ